MMTKTYYFMLAVIVHVCIFNIEITGQTIEHEIEGNYWYIHFEETMMGGTRWRHELVLRNGNCYYSEFSDHGDYQHRKSCVGNYIIREDSLILKNPVFDTPTADKAWWHFKDTTSNDTIIIGLVLPEGVSFHAEQFRFLQFDKKSGESTLVKPGRIDRHLDRRDPSWLIYDSEQRLDNVILFHFDPRLRAASMIIHYGDQYSILVQNSHHIKGVLVDLEQAQSDSPFTEKAFIISQEGTTTIFSDIVRPEPYGLRRDYKKYNNH